MIPSFLWTLVAMLTRYPTTDTVKADIIEYPPATSFVKVGLDTAKKPRRNSVKGFNTQHIGTKTSMTSLSPLGTTSTSTKHQVLVPNGPRTTDASKKNTEPSKATNPKTHHEGVGNSISTQSEIHSARAEPGDLFVNIAKPHINPMVQHATKEKKNSCLLYTSPSPRDS